MQSVLRPFLSMQLVLLPCLVIPVSSAFAQFGPMMQHRRGRPKTVHYVYNGQEFEFITMNQNVFEVLRGQTIVLLNMNGSVMPYPNVDPHITAAAEDALKAYQAGKPSGSVTAPAASSGSGKPLTIDGIVLMLNAGVPEDVILAKIRSAPNSFDPSPEDLVRLKKAKASDAVMKAMMEPKTAPAAPVAGSPQPASAANPSAPQAAQASRSSEPQIAAPEGTEEKKQGFFGRIRSSVSDEIHGNTVIDKIGLRDILPQYDPNKPLSEQWPHVAITVLYAPTGWMEPWMTDTNVHSNSIFPPCFKLQATIWKDAQHPRKTRVFEWCSNKDERMTELPVNYLFSMEKPVRDRDELTGINRTQGPEPPDTLLPNDRQTMDMEARGSSRHRAIDLNLDQRTRFAMMFANVRADLGETLTSTGDFRVWVVSIKKAAGPPLFR